MAIKYLGTSTKPLTRELCEDFATMPRTRTERPMKQARLDFLAHENEAGRFHAPRWAIAYLGDKRLRINGQHSSTMLANANGHFPEGLSVIIDEYRVDQELDLAELFNRYDRPESNRTTRELYGIEVAVEDLLASMSPTDVRQIVGGIAFCTDPHNNKATARDRAQLVHHHQDFIRWCEPFAKCRKLGRVPALACVYKSWEKSPDAAAEFWTLVHNASHPDPKHPSRVLSDLLLVTARRGGNSNHQRWNKLEVHVKCIRAWNAWRTNQVSTLLKVLESDTKKFPEVI